MSVYQTANASPRVSPVTDSMGGRENALGIIAASYERVSTRAQGQYGFSLGAQHQSLDDFARAQGWTLPEHLRFRDGEDENASGADWDLPGLTAMLEAASSRAFTVLVVPDFDHFARTLVKGLVLEEQLKKHGVRVVFQRVPVEDSPEGQLFKTQLYAFAEYDRQKIILRTMTGRRHKARNGKVVGNGVPPYGLRYVWETLENGKRRVCGLEPDPMTGPIARDILRSLRTRSTIDVAADLNRRGVPGPTKDTPWNTNLVWRMGRSRVYVGAWSYAGIAVPVAPLIGEDEHAAIQAALDRRQIARRGRKPVDQDPFLLRGLLTCGHCRGQLKTKTPNRRRYYQCARGDLAVVRAADVEAELWRVLSETLLNPDYLRAGLESARAEREAADRTRAERLGALDREIAKHRKRLDNLAVGLADAGSGEALAALLRASKDVERLVDGLDRERAELVAVKVGGLSVEEAESLAAFAAEIRAGLEHATDADKRALYELVQIRGTVYDDPHGVRLGRSNRFRIEWTAALPLAASSTGLL